MSHSVLNGWPAHNELFTLNSPSLKRLCHLTTSLLELSSSINVTVTIHDFAENAQYRVMTLIFLISTAMVSKNMHSRCRRDFGPIIC